MFQTGLNNKGMLPSVPSKLDIKMIDSIKATKHLSDKDTAFFKDLQGNGQQDYPLSEKPVVSNSKTRPITSRFCCSFLSMSIDTIHIEINRIDVDGLNCKEITVDKDGLVKKEFGYIDCIKVIHRADKTRIECSLPKLLVKNNVFCLSYFGITEAIRLLENQLGISLQKGIIRRLDLFINIETKNPPVSYFMFLGDSQYFYKNTVGKTTLYFKNKNRELYFYDKIKEMKDKKTDIPDICSGKYLMRIEYRLYNTYIKDLFDKPLYLKSMLSEETMMILIGDFIKVYSSIFREQKPTVNLDTCQTTKEFRCCLMQEGINSTGGINSILEMIDNFKLRSPHLRTEVFSRLKKEAKDIVKMKGFSRNEDYIIELDSKFMEGCKEFIESIKNAGDNE